MMYKFFFGLIILLPLIGAIIQGALGIKESKKTGALATLFIFSSFLLHLLIINSDEKEILYFPFIIFSDFEVYFSFLINKINILMGLMVTFVSGLIHLYSIGYMEMDESPGRYFSYLNLFVFFMLLIVYSGNFLLMFIGWEGVGLCSYLLISYESWREEARDAGTKAFLVTRFADFGFIVFLLLYYKIFGTFEINALKEVSYNSLINNSLIIWILIFAFIAACGKSAQFPFYVWLPDAMEGPTPVSALIHAATMVTAGVWLMIKLFSLSYIYPEVLNLILIISSITFIISGLIASFERDLKKILAYSTISQIGYMFFAIGIGYPLFAFLHLLTHAFFKALLFLSSGNVMHLIHKKINIFETRGIRKVHPFTAYTFFLGSLALIGFPLTGGFISKELIINASFSKPIFFYLASFGAFLTAFYIIRGYSLCFEGDKKEKHYEKISKVMNIALALLGVFVILTGLPAFESLYFEIFDIESHFETPLLLRFFPLFLAAVGMYIAFERYTKKTPSLKGRYYKLSEFFLRGLYYDDFISKFLFGIIKKFSFYISKLFDRGFIDLGIVEGSGKLISFAGNFVYRFFKGKPSFYLLTILTFFFFLLLQFLK